MKRAPTRDLYWVRLDTCTPQAVGTAYQAGAGTNASGALGSGAAVESDGFPWNRALSPLGGCLEVLGGDGQR